ncbi:MAG: hypothetical protein ACXV4D_03905 [Ilumatobacteraceae bacterium]
MDRWRGALEERDTARVGQLVEIAHAVREARLLARPGLHDGLVI